VVRLVEEEVRLVEEEVRLVEEEVRLVEEGVKLVEEGEVVDNNHRYSRRNNILLDNMSRSTDFQNVDTE
jgi:hypothetical protein